MVGLLPSAVCSEATVTPTTRGVGSTLDVIPFVIVGPRDMAVDPVEPPLIGVARSALAQYRLDADYRHQLYNSGQETFVTVNLPEDQRPKVVGSGVIINLPEGGDAKYVGPNAVGIAAHRTAIVDERDAGIAAGARIFGGVQSEADLDVPFSELSRRRQDGLRLIGNPGREFHRGLFFDSESNCVGTD
jgi:hypothetical protein